MYSRCTIVEIFLLNNSCIGKDVQDESANNCSEQNAETPYILPQNQPLKPAHKTMLNIPSIDIFIENIAVLYSGLRFKDCTFYVLGRLWFCPTTFYYQSFNMLMGMGS